MNSTSRVHKERIRNNFLKVPLTTRKFHHNCKQNLVLFIIVQFNLKNLRKLHSQRRKFHLSVSLTSCEFKKKNLRQNSTLKILMDSNFKKDKKSK